MVTGDLQIFICFLMFDIFKIFNSSLSNFSDKQHDKIECISVKTLLGKVCWVKLTNNISHLKT